MICPTLLTPVGKMLLPIRFRREHLILPFKQSCNMPLSKTHPLLGYPNSTTWMHLHGVAYRTYRSRIVATLRTWIWNMNLSQHQIALLGGRGSFPSLSVSSSSPICSTSPLPSRAWKLFPQIFHRMTLLPTRAVGHWSLRWPLLHNLKQVLIDTCFLPGWINAPRSNHQSLCKIWFTL